ncbi:MAG TPA: hypothetical protein VFF80_07380 [Bacillota bacterium]|nr:hypothetical protein [Bacillota bacterium]
MQELMKYSRTIGLAVLALFFFSRNYIEYSNSTAIVICLIGIILLFVGFAYDKNSKNSQNHSTSN